MKEIWNRGLRVFRRYSYGMLRRRAQQLSMSTNVEVSSKGLETVRALIYVGDGTEGAHHIYRQWRDFFVEADIAFGVLFRSARSFDQCRAEYPEDLLLYANKPQDVDAVFNVADSLRTVYHTGNPRNVFDLLRHRHVKHVSIFHGDGEKQANLNPMFRVYDELWVAGQAQIDRLAPDIPSHRFRIVGRPQVIRLIDAGESAVDNQKMAAYLPTWESGKAATNYSSAALAPDLVNVIQRHGYSAIAKMHPSTGHRIRDLLQTDSKVTDVLLGASVVCPRANNAIDIMLRTDVCITDTSSIVSDWLATKRPVFVYQNGAVSSRAKMSLSDYAYVFSSVNEFEALFKRVMVDGDDFKAEARRIASEYLISPGAISSNAFVRQLIAEVRSEG